MYPERLDGGQDLLLVAREGHAHSQQVSMETEQTERLGQGSSTCGPRYVSGLFMN